MTKFILDFGQQPRESETQIRNVRIRKDGVLFFEDTFNRTVAAGSGLGGDWAWSNWNSSVSAVADSPTYVSPSSAHVPYRYGSQAADAVADTFTRTVATGPNWGTVETPGPSTGTWSSTGAGFATAFEVASGKGVIKRATAGTNSSTLQIGWVHEPGGDVTFTASARMVSSGATTTGDKVFFSLAGEASGFVEVNLDALGNVTVFDDVGSHGTTVTGFTALDEFKVRIEATATSANIRLWKASDPEPGTWTSTATLFGPPLERMSMGATYSASGTNRTEFDDVDWASTGGPNETEFADSYETVTDYEVADCNTMQFDYLVPSLSEQASQSWMELLDDEGNITALGLEALDDGDSTFEIYDYWDGLVELELTAGEWYSFRLDYTADGTSSAITVWLSGTSQPSPQWVSDGFTPCEDEEEVGFTPTLTVTYTGTSFAGATSFRLGKFGPLTSSGYVGSTGDGELQFDDMGAALSPIGLRAVHVDDSLCTPARIFTGYAANRDVEYADSLMVGSQRRWTAALVDQNAIFSFRIIRGSGARRPVETDIERITWLLGTTYVVGLEDLGLVDTANAVTLDETDYTGRYPADVLGDCTSASAKNFFAYYSEDDDAIGLGYFKPKSTFYTSAISLSNVLSDIDFDTVFPVETGAKLTRDPSQIYSGAYSTHDMGAVYVTDATTASTWFPRDMSVSGAHTASFATFIAERFLEDSDEEYDEVRCTVRLPRNRVNWILEGQRVAIKMQHYPGFEDYIYKRVLRRSVSQMPGSDEYYVLELELGNPLLIRQYWQPYPNFIERPPGTQRPPPTDQRRPKPPYDCTPVPDSFTSMDFDTFTRSTDDVYPGTATGAGAQLTLWGIGDAGGQWVVQHAAFIRAYVNSAEGVIDATDSSVALGSSGTATVALGGLGPSGFAIPCTITMDLVSSGDYVAPPSILDPRDITISLTTKDDVGADGPSVSLWLVNTHPVDGYQSLLQSGDDQDTGPSHGSFFGQVTFSVGNTSVSVLDMTVQWDFAGGTFDPVTLDADAIVSGISISVGRYTKLTVNNISVYDAGDWAVPVPGQDCDGPTTGQPVVNEVVGFGDGTTVLFEADWPYQDGSLIAYVGGIRVLVNETDPSAGTFTLPFAPSIVEQIVVTYKGR